MCNKLGWNEMKIPINSLRTNPKTFHSIQKMQQWRPQTEHMNSLQNTFGEVFLFLPKG
jgi:hypothetical protein